MSPLRQSIEQNLVQLNLDANDFSSILQAAVNLAVEQGKIQPEHAQQAVAALERREAEGATAIGHAVAVPHAYLDCFQEQVILFLRLARPLNLGAPDGISTRFVFVLLGPESAVVKHIDALTGVARLMSDDQFRYEAAIARDTEDLTSALESYSQRTIEKPKPVDTSTEDPFIYTGRLFGGVVNDIKRRWPHYGSDFCDGLNSKTVSFCSSVN